MKKWKTLSSELVFDNKWFKVQKDKVELPDGKILDDYYLWKNKEAAMIFALTSEKKIILVKQYKHGIGDFIVECPAGYVEEGEKPEETIKRELLEETGYKVKEIVPLSAVIHHPTKESEKLYLFLSEDVEKIGFAKGDDTEDIEVIELPISKVLEMIKEGKIWASGTICAVFLGLNKLGYKYELH